MSNTPKDKELTSLDLLQSIETDKSILRNELPNIPLIDNKKRYLPIRQNQISDNITKGLLEPKQLSIFDGSATTKIDTKQKQEFVLTIEKFEELENILSNELYTNNKANQSAGKLLDSFLIKMTENGFSSPLATIPLKEYAEMTGKKDLKELRSRTKSDLQVLKRVKFSYTPKKKSKANNQDYMNVYLFGGTEGIKNGNITFKFNDDFFRIFAEQKNFLLIPAEVLQSNERKNPHTYLLYKKIVSHKRMNLGKKNENIIKAKTLYEYCVTLPRYDEIKEAGQFSKRIREPFERDLDIIKEFTWRYDSEETPSNFNEWINTNIIIKWNKDQPDTSTIVAGRNKQQKMIDKAKQKAIEKQIQRKQEKENNN